MLNERRDDKRVRLPLEMRWDGKASGHTARVYDISLSGCYIESIAHVTMGERIGFEVQLPTGSWLPLHGEVVHYQPDMGFALRFLDLSEQDRNTLAWLIEYVRDG